MRESVAALHTSHLPIAAFLSQAASWKDSVLGLLCYSAQAGSAMTDSRQPCVRVHMPRLDSGDSICEIWRGQGKIVQGESGAIRYRHDGEILFGEIALSETSFAATDGASPLQQATELAYREVFELLDATGFPHLYRFWNYMPEINVHSYGLERYRQFNQGRQAAFAAWRAGIGENGRDVANIPAACALGTSGGPLCIAFLAGRVKPLRIENSRQISAYDYPQQYGPRAPLFARATLVKQASQTVLFVSGTASVVGHATVHPHDVAAQVRETVANLQSVLAEANRQADDTPFSLGDLSCRVYVRRPADLPQIRLELARCAGDALNAVYVQADVCREDLLLEIEASAIIARQPACGRQG